MVTLLVYVSIFSVMIGACLGAYCQLYYLSHNVVFAWDDLVPHAIAKRQALLKLSGFSQYHQHSLPQEIDFLSQHHKLSRRTFLKDSYDIVFAFREMEESLSQLVHEILQSVQSHKEDAAKIAHYIEDFWASDNLFSFKSVAYEQAVERYLEERSSPSLWMAARLFRFLDVPRVRFFR